MNVSDACDDCDRILDTISEGVVAEREFLETVLTAVLARGHVLIEDVPGTGKTLTARSFASALGLSFSRVQFTPDLLPADVTGTHVYREGDGKFEFSEGPIFANFVLADEINRAPPKTQAALLEAMAEGQVTVDGDTHPLPEPFVVVATQNPVESEGVFPLPEAQRDRFLVKTSIGYPEASAERGLLRQRTERESKAPSVDDVLDPEGVRRLQSVPERVTVDDDILSYLIDIVHRTRRDARTEVGVSPRGSQRLLEAARSHAVIAGREYVRPVDVQTVGAPVLAHRLVLTTDATVDGTTADDVVADVFDSVAVPTVSPAAPETPAAGE
ncbi:AAA family ATPase [Haloarcula argentinensis]|uniref:MoxR family ATPase n=1 Tax=Haloarcula argentinensis TaxID=43776 RepID=A0ABU2F1P0_HALAR|nr:MoxR family ATPase [Haloarcula argentinensis]EMA19704.1 ATPase associated with various cellular activities AAA_3 [Haloarcula argentinensis DSM 12282]MDS0254467.1 MoxR family ATPase [Haloarcula argentinensis]